MTDFPTYTRAERLFDGVIHVTGVGAALAGLVTLLVLAGYALDLVSVFALIVYGAALLATFSFSAAYNLVQHHHPSKEWLRRLDHAAIFLMIAGTYTPFALLALPRGEGLILLALVWCVALAGMVLKLFWPHRLKRGSVVLYLVQGWAVVFVLDTLVVSLDTAPLVLLGLGGCLYTLGVVFHIWESLPFQNAIWHLFVLAAASCHFAAVLAVAA